MCFQAQRVSDIQSPYPNDSSLKQQSVDRRVTRKEWHSLYSYILTDKKANPVTLK